MNQEIEQLEIDILLKYECTALHKLSESTDFSKHKIKQIMHRGALWLTRGKQTSRIRRAKKVLKPGDELHLYYNRNVFEKEPQPAHLIHDASDYSVWHKPYGMYSQGTKWGDHCTVYRWAETHLKPQRPAFIVHRLDRAATGLILVAHKKKVTAAFTEIFQKRLIEKKYQVIVRGEFPKDPEITTLDTRIDNRRAVSHVKRLSHDQKKNRSLLRVLIETGRKHQIRKHLSEAGYPVVGDRLYGDAQKDDAENLQLCSCSLAFICPVDHVRKEFVLPGELRLK